jgi:TPR repeat protein
MGIDLRKVLRIAGDEEPGRQKLCAIMKDLYPYPEYIREINVLTAVFDSGIPKIIRKNGGLTKVQYVRSIKKIEREYGIEEYLAVKAIDTWGEAYVRPGVFSDYHLEDLNSKALEWNQRVTEDGNESEMNTPDVVYENGEGVEQDDKDAVSWYRKANVMYNLGYLYDHGRGVKRDNKKAMYWYRKAAEAGNTEAMNSLGVAYCSGEGVEQDNEEALHWFRKAAKEGNTDAMYNLGNAYRNGEGVEQDDIEAVHWFKKSAEAGCEDAELCLSYLRNKLSKSRQ